MPDLSFPPTFLWGAATASHQIEGGRDERGESIWDRFARIPGKVRNGDTGDIACDHVHRWRDDVALMRDLGLRSYRFSLSWPRILPAGSGPVNTAGLDFYDRLTDALLENGIQPAVTLYHWDLPQSLEDAGGWPARATVDRYAAYVEIALRRLGDRVKIWITHNEPWLVGWLGYGRGIHAPGRESPRDALATIHHLLLSHGHAVRLVRSLVPDARVGITLHHTPVFPVSDDPADVAAAWRADGTAHRWFLDPLYRGQYPADIMHLWEADLPAIHPGDMDLIATPTDFLGINYYSRRVVRAGEQGEAVTVRQEGEHMTVDSEVYPAALLDALLRIRRDYAPPSIYITENGAAFEDVRLQNGAVLDPERRAYLESHIRTVADARAAGVPVDAYYAWSLLDNYEWAYGYQKRFGLIYVDYPTQERIPKASYTWYRDFIRTQP